ncbi:SpoIID/LytB domain-containing protein [Citricoccus sp. I39-566]|uniref:SpoIID/LytB domain-containing protein n=1 Tax=Citricoccus sp. I39-566 TaxID=3073268 RepID=UPI00286BC7AB|nr:SpoIID/LytB domain-containing protein [Citricoccus sp. I39-566]WMY79485.1 SpoIID/LytB domain-containing protein [Citricoccus sp. I39-566]
MPIITVPAAAEPRAFELPRILVLLLAAVLVLGAGPLVGPAVPAHAATPSSFPDVPSSHTFHEAVTWMIQQEITEGESDGTFGVNDDIARAEASAFLFRLVDPDVTPPEEQPFKDIPDDPDWYAYTPIAWMATEGIINGYDDETFRPYRSITRGEMAKILYGVAEADAPAPTSAPFSDVPADSSYAQYIAWMKSESISRGYADDTFRPGRPISRGEAAQLIWKVAGEMGYDTTVFPVSFAVSGSGWGHGVGMSQYGARAMAIGGSTYGQILDHYYSPAVVQNGPNRVNENIRVHLVSTQKIAVDGSGQVRVIASGSTQAPATAGAVTFTADGDQVVATLPDGTTKRSGSVALEWTGTRFWKGAASTLTVPDANGTSTDLVLRHGRVQVTLNDDGQLNVVNELRMNDEYLYGVDEMPSSWAPAALQAQTVAGRSYALRNMGSLKSACDCHVYDDVRSQKFTGWAKENEGNGLDGAKWKAAVSATSQQILTHNGSVADATYFSSSAGRTRGAQEQWGNAVPYLTSKSDPYSVRTREELGGADPNPNNSWTQSVTQGQMAGAFGLPNVVTVTETAQNKNSGYTDWITATASDGTTSQITGNQFRSRLGLKSSFIVSVTPR